MAKTHNLLIKSKDGKLILATGKGLVANINQKIVKSQLLGLIEKRQEVGKQLTDALERAGFEVEAHSNTDVYDPTPQSRKKST